jgi:tripartite ATP-independent transporter DctM subunit
MTMFYAALAVMLLLMLGGSWISVALGIGSVAALLGAVGPERMAGIIGSVMWSTNNDFVLLALPLYLLMGELLYQSGILQGVFQAADILCRRLPGRLLQTTLASSAVFAACSGSSIANAAALGRIAYPIMLKQGYNRDLLLGTIAAGGTLGILIPPSTIMIVYGAMSEASIGKLFLAGVVPGLILTAVFCVYVGLYARFRPVTSSSAALSSTGLTLAGALRKLAPIILLVLAVLGGLYGGVATPSEIGAVGAAVALAYALIWTPGGFGDRVRVVKESVFAALETTSMMMLIVVAGKLMAVSIAYYNIPPLLRQFVSSLELPALVVVAGILLLYVILSTVFDDLSIMIVTLPFFLPILQAYAIDLVWFGVLLTIIVQLGLLSPPVGLNLFVLQGVTGAPFDALVRGSLPFMLLLGAFAVCIAVWPELALWLPRNALQ